MKLAASLRLAAALSPHGVLCCRVGSFTCRPCVPTRSVCSPTWRGQREASSPFSFLSSLLLFAASSSYHILSTEVS